LVPLLAEVLGNSPVPFLIAAVDYPVNWEHLMACVLAAADLS
jgi:hypothetical protein